MNSKTVSKIVAKLGRVIIATLLGAGINASAMGSKPTALESEAAIEIMTKTCSSFDEYNSGQFKAYVSIDEDLEGIKVQENFLIDIKVKRPNKFKMSSQGDRVAAVFYDGQKLSAVDYNKGFYAQKQFKGNLPDLLNLAEELNVPTPMLDFLEKNNCLESLTKVSTSKVLGDLTINGEPVKHLLFRNEKDEIDWQVWVRKVGDRYALKKAVVTSRYIAEQPQFQFTIFSEQLDPVIDDEDFDFFAYDALTKIDFMADVIKESQTQPLYRGAPVARRTARRTARRVTRRAYIRTLPANCAWRAPYYACGGVYYQAVIEDGVTVYIVVEN